MSLLQAEREESSNGGPRPRKTLWEQMPELRRLPRLNLKHLGEVHHLLNENETEIAGEGVKILLN